jgi:5-methylcytosine-specific restriction endonuclease McrA
LGQGTCGEDDCGRPIAAKGKCMRHYQRRHKPISPVECAVDRCTKTSRTRGWCPMHYARWLKTGSTDEPVRTVALCGEPDCDAAATRRGLCEMHYRRIRWAENGEQIRATQAAWRGQNRERLTALYRDWERRNPEKVSLRDRQNKGRRRATISSPDPVNYARILVEHGMVCHICAEQIPSLDDLEFDHVIPLARGGAHSVENIRPSHSSCNRRKGAKLPA